MTTQGQGAGASGDDAAVRLGDAHYRAVVDHTGDVIQLIGADGLTRFVNPAVRALLGREPADLVGRSFLDLVHPDDRADAQREFALVFHDRGPGTYRTDLRARHVDGSWRWIEALSLNRLDDPEVGALVCTWRDVTERRRLEAELAHRAVHDPLTGLPNRAALREAVRAALDRAARSGATTAALFCDLDHFKLVNDALGHGAGDGLLREVAGRLRACLRPGDLVARFGGDEFVVLCENVGDAEAARSVGERVRAAVSGPYPVDGTETHVSLSVGLGVAGPSSTVDQLVSDADAALFRAKKRGRDRVEAFSEGMREVAERRLVLGRELRRALREGELRLHFQPKLELSTGRWASVEALLRWQHPRRGLLGPGDFLPLAAESDLVTELDTWALHAACAQAAAWRERLADPPVVTVNLSARQLARRDLVDVVLDAIDRSGARAEDLGLEVTEDSLLLDPLANAESLRVLRARGVASALDDFGTGYSPLAWLTQLPVDVLKVDRSFVTRVDHDPRAHAVVASVLLLARSLGLRSVAEGVETEQQLAVLRALGCDVAQGYLLCRPLPADAAEQLLRTGAAAPAVAAG